MAALSLRQTQISGRNVSTTATIPEDNLAKLMYYLNCVNYLLEGSPFPSHLRDFANYYSASQDTQQEVVAYAYLFNPSELLGKVFHPVSANHSELGGSGNAFIELTAASHQFVITGEFLVGGKRVQTAKIMLCTEAWLRDYWELPMKALFE